MPPPGPFGLLFFGRGVIIVIMIVITFRLSYSAISSRSQRFRITDTVHMIKCKLVAAANQRQLQHSNTQDKTNGLGSRWFSHDSFAQFSNESGNESY